MDFRVTFSEKSLRDLREILAYIAEDNPQAAEDFGRQLVNLATNLRRFPIRYPRDKRRANLRKTSLGSYLVYYEVLESERVVNILHFWHGARQPPML